MNQPISFANQKGALVRSGPIFVCILVLLLTACETQSTPEPQEPRQPPATSSVEPRDAEPRDAEPSVVDQPQAPATDYQPQIEQTECPAAYDQINIESECGFLTVPENRARPDSRNVRLAYAILFTDNANAPADPIIFLEGGPGGSAVYDPASWLDFPLLQTRDFILFDQRGTGYSEPSLNCREEEELDESGDIFDATLACQARLTSEGIDLSLYNSATSAADLNDLRLALEIDTWNLLGISYGTRFALNAMRDYPQGIRSVILDSSYPPNVEAYNEEAANGVRAFQNVFSACASDALCNAAYPNLDDVFYALIDELDGEPAEFTYIDPDTDEEITDEVDGSVVVDNLFQSMYVGEHIPVLPYAIYEAAAGNYDVVLDIEYYAMGDEAFDESFDEEFIEEPVEDEDRTDSEGLYYSVECHERIPFNDIDDAYDALADAPPQLADHLIAGVEQLFDTCAIWGAGEADDIEFSAVRSSIPTLILAGQFDPVTPPSWGRRTAEHLDNGYYFELPAQAHSVLSTNTCAQEIAVAFVDDPASQPDGSCIDAMSAPQFLVP